MQNTWWDKPERASEREKKWGIVDRSMTPHTPAHFLESHKGLSVEDWTSKAKLTDAALAPLPSGNYDSVGNWKISDMIFNKRNSSVRVTVQRIQTRTWVRRGEGRILGEVLLLLQWESSLSALHRTIISFCKVRHFWFAQRLKPQDYLTN